MKKKIYLNAIRIVCTSFLLAGSLKVFQNAFADSACPSSIENKKDPISFVAFKPEDLRHADGTPYRSMAEQMDILDEAGKVIRSLPAGEFLVDLNDFESKLNAWGYSLRIPAGKLIGGLYTCMATLNNQVQKTQELLRKDMPLTKQLNEFMPNFDESWKRYKADIPSWEELKKKSTDVNYSVYLPDKPSLAIAPPLRARVELKPLFKERPWPFNWGEGKDFNVFGKANLSVKASKLEATARGTLEMNGKIVGKDVGEILGIIANAESPGTDKMKASIEVRVAGKKILNYEKSGLSIREDNSNGFPVDWSTEYRFAIGPVPMRARIGFLGELGIKHGFSILPLHLGAYATPFTRSKAYAQVGADIYVGGAGVSGELTLVNLDVPLTADIEMQWDSSPEIKLDLRGSATVDALSGRLYSYVFVFYPSPWPPWKNKWNGEWDFFKWEGLKWKGNLFEYNAKYSPAGIVAKGDLKAEDVAEIQAVETEARLAELKNVANQYTFDVIKALSTDLNQEDVLRIKPETETLKTLWTNDIALLDSYSAELKNWIQRQ